jgi:hypothetical protein
LASTALTLFVVPILYTLFNRDTAVPIASEEEEAPPAEQHVATQ